VLSYLIDDPVVGENEVANVNEGEDISITPLEGENCMESLNLPVLIEEVPSPENTVDIQSDDHLQVQSNESMSLCFAIVY